MFNLEMASTLQLPGFLLVLNGLKAAIGLERLAVGVSRKVKKNMLERGRDLLYTFLN